MLKTLASGMWNVTSLGDVGDQEVDSQIGAAIVQDCHGEWGLEPEGEACNLPVDLCSNSPSTMRLWV